MDEEATTSPVFDFQTIEFCRRRNFVGLTNSCVRLQDTKTVVVFDIERIFPAQIAHVLDPGKLRRPKWSFEWMQCHPRAALIFVLSFGHTTGANRSLRFSTRTLRAARPNARCARATNAGCFSAVVLFRSFLINKSNAELNLHHRSPKSPFDFLSRFAETHRLRTSAAEHDQRVSRKRSLCAIRESRIASSPHGKIIGLLQVAQAFGVAIALSSGAGFATGRSYF